MARAHALIAYWHVATASLTTSKSVEEGFQSLVCHANMYESGTRVEKHHEKIHRSKRNLPACHARTSRRKNLLLNYLRVSRLLSKSACSPRPIVIFTRQRQRQGQRTYLTIIPQACSWVQESLDWIGATDLRERQLRICSMPTMVSFQTFIFSLLYVKGQVQPPQQCP